MNASRQRKKGMGEEEEEEEEEGPSRALQTLLPFYFTFLNALYIFPKVERRTTSSPNRAAANALRSPTLAGWEHKKTSTPHVIDAISTNNAANSQTHAKAFSFVVRRFSGISQPMMTPPKISATVRNQAATASSSSEHVPCSEVASSGDTRGVWPGRATLVELMVAVNATIRCKEAFKRQSNRAGLLLIGARRNQKGRKRKSDLNKYQMLGLASATATTSTSTVDGNHNSERISKLQASDRPMKANDWAHSTGYRRDHAFPSPAARQQRSPRRLHICTKLGLR
jgi:hypothetical protein